MTERRLTMKAPPHPFERIPNYSGGHGHSHGEEGHGHSHSHGDQDHAEHGHSHGGEEHAAHDDHGHSHSHGGQEHGHSHGEVEAGSHVPLTETGAPKGISFHEETSHPAANLDRASNQHEFIMPDMDYVIKSLAKATEKLTGFRSDVPDLSELEKEINTHNITQMKGSAVHNDVKLPEKAGDIVFQAIFGSVDSVRTSVENYGADTMQLDDSGFTALHYACRRPNYSIAKYLIEECHMPVNLISENERKESLLTLASEGGDLQVAHLLVSRGADMHYKNAMGYAPLHIAIQKGNMLLAVYFLSAGADIEILDKWEHSPLQLAALFANGRLVSIMLKYGANPLHQDQYQMTALHWAASKGNLEAVKMLYAEDPSAAGMKEKNGLTPLEVAVKKDNTEVVEFLSKQTRTNMSQKLHNYLNIVGILGEITSPQFLEFCYPAVYIPVFLYFLAYTSWFYSLAAAVGLVGVTVYLFKSPELKSRNLMLMGTFLWSHLYSNLLYFGSILPRSYTILWYHIPFFIFNLVFYELYRQLAFWDPGYLEPEKGDLVAMIQEVNKGNNPSNFCTTCWLRRPFRAKHCRDCDRCVLKADHHCPFTGNCVGPRNMWKFVLCQYIFAFLEISFYIFIYYYGRHQGYGSDSTTYWQMLGILNVEEPLLIAFLIWHILNASWMLLLVCQNTYQVSINITTNETWNWSRYPYFREPETNAYLNPFDRGLVRNWQEVFCDSFEQVKARTKTIPQTKKNVQRGDGMILPLYDSSVKNL